MYEPSGSRKLEALRHKPLRVAVYNCYEATEPSLTLRNAPLEEILNGTPAWVPMGVYMDQCGQDSDWASRPVLTAMIKEGWYDLIICKSISHLHTNLAGAIKAMAVLNRCGIRIYFEAEDVYSGNPSDMRNLMVMANIEALTEKAADKLQDSQEKAADKLQDSQEKAADKLQDSQEKAEVIV